MVVKKTFRLTKDGVAEMEAELAHLHSSRVEIADAIRIAREFGDLSENTEYQSSRAAQERNDARISEIEHILQNVELIKPPKAGAKVQLGSKVTLKGASGKKEFQVVGTVEADPLNGKISDESPIGQALLGKKEGDKVEIQTPAETASYTVAAIG
ncbi:MAG: greA [Candidatus Saccharibacteria bacterium]|nr:greA [Candidatus Saccharibacteria bacterium]